MHALIDVSTQALYLQKSSLHQIRKVRHIYSPIRKAVDCDLGEGGSQYAWCGSLDSNKRIRFGVVPESK